MTQLQLSYLTVVVSFSLRIGVVMDKTIGEKNADPTECMIFSPTEEAFTSPWPMLHSLYPGLFCMNLTLAYVAFTLPWPILWSLYPRPM